MATTPTIMATVARKLENEDIRAIFESLHDCKPPPLGLKFQIVRVGADGLRLSPPAHEYEDGIYVLLRPDKSKTKKKKKNGETKEQDDSPQIPPHLAHLEMKTPLSKNCTWSLSGPQFPKPTAIQQRYCYPQGNIEYASKKGGSMWTMYNREGKEDDEYRLLHVYYSIKRANNVSSTSVKAKVSSNPSKVKRKKKPPRKSLSVGIRKRVKKQKHPAPKVVRRVALARSLPTSSPSAMKNQIFRQSHRNVSPSTTSTSGAIHRALSRQGGSFGVTFEGHKIHPVPSILYNNEYCSFPSRKVNSYDPSENHLPRSGDYLSSQNESPPDLAREFDTMLGVPLADPSSMMKDSSTEWSSLMGGTDTKDVCVSDFRRNERYPDILIQQLRAVHKNIIHEWIDSRPRSERGRLLSILANWARSISRSPLEIPTSKEGDDEKRAFGDQGEDWDVAVEV